MKVNKQVLHASIVETGIVFSKSERDVELGGRPTSFLSGLLCPFPFLTSPSSFESHVAFKDIIWCEQASNINSFSDDPSSQHVLNLIYLNSAASNPSVQIRTITIIRQDTLDTEALVSEILAEAYLHSILKPRLLVLINPHGGKGRAAHIYRTYIEPVFSAANAQVTYIQTLYSKHAMDIARDLDINKYDAIVCCSGDGIPHEVLNGFYLRPDKGASAFSKVAISQLPCGSGNALSLSTHGTDKPALAALRLLKAGRFKMDVMAVTQGKGTEAKTHLSFLSQSLGVIADLDIGTEHLRWMGQIRFDIGVAQYIYQKRTYPCDLYVKSVAQGLDDISALYKKVLAENAAKVYDTDQSQSKLELCLNDLDSHFPDLSLPIPSDWQKVPDEITSKLLIFYTGKMPIISKDVNFFPAALPNDGTMDLVLMDNTMSLLHTAKTLYAADRGRHVFDKRVFYSKILAYRLVPRLEDNKRHYFSVDGEHFDVRTTQAEVLSQVVTVLLGNNTYAAPAFRR